MVLWAMFLLLSIWGLFIFVCDRTKLKQYPSLLCARRRWNTSSANVEANSEGYWKIKKDRLLPICKYGSVGHVPFAFWGLFIFVCDMR